MTNVARPAPAPTGIASRALKEKMIIYPLQTLRRRAVRWEDNRVQFALNPEQTLLKDAMDAFVRDHNGTGTRRTDRGQSRGYSAENWRSLAELGVLGLPFAAEEGGLGSGPRELVTVME